MKSPSILDPKFRYVPSVQTNLRATFARVRREMKQEAERIVEEQKSKVRSIAKGKP